MLGKILLINRGTAFLTNALVSSLKNMGISTELVAPELEAVQRKQEGADVLLLFAESDAAPSAELLLYLKELCATDNRYLCVLGYNKELSVVEDIISPDAIRYEFHRPIDVKTITEELYSLFRRDEEEARHILLVDDDVTFLKIMQGWLSEKYKVTAVKSGAQAVKFISTHTPDLVLLDYDMPVTSGPQVLKIIRGQKKASSFPVIFLTGKNDRESVMSVMSLKPDGYLLKTLGRASILEAVDDFIAKAYSG